ncbi:hypothetical protein BABINDRAFT_162217 [Babjeviella inositovora NRRL Y-12698]|uniref:Uncharacterized protein n=1 Tax=Babjeviella inositovora NRRL Y-12698 TaxID=984486 RepID=A0A1E3QNY9_9ASCO|nr:uncharacterized protein BABINDRAFT_162217 [Babjeviella inositovora NRRL Y-12698]ODQ79164.1 hypothetical protein BABINDRAFT_162217 [Babjeviella inositovora NRRL Y-12698]
MNHNLGPRCSAVSKHHSPGGSNRLGTKKSGVSAPQVSTADTPPNSGIDISAYKCRSTYAILGFDCSLWFKDCASNPPGRRKETANN